MLRAVGDDEAAPQSVLTCTRLELALQTQALYGRPKSVAYYLDYLQRNGAAADEIGFWKERAAETPKTRAAVLRLSA